MNLSDPLERLRAVNPVPPGAALAPPDRVLFTRITSGEPLSEIAHWIAYCTSSRAFLRPIFSLIWD